MVLKNRSHVFRLITQALIFTVVLAGCASNAGWQYTPNAAEPASDHLPLTLAVEKFQDQRATGNTTYAWLCLFPLVPSCDIDYNRPDSANGFLTAGAYNFRPSDDLANAVATEVRQTELFHDVYVTDRTLDPNAQLILRGMIKNTAWNGQIYAYLLGVYRGLLYLFALPAGTAYNSLQLELQLVKQSNGEVLWSYTIDQHYEKTIGIYYNFGKDFGYPQMLRAGIEPAIESLEQFLRSKPDSYWSAMMPTEAANGASVSPPTK